MKFIWTKQEHEVEIEMGGLVRGLMRRGERPDLLILTEYEMYGSDSPFRDDKWELERYIAHHLKPVLAVGGSIEIVSSCKISI